MPKIESKERLKDQSSAFQRANAQYFCNFFAFERSAASRRPAFRPNIRGCANKTSPGGGIEIPNSDKRAQRSAAGQSRGSGRARLFGFTRAHRLSRMCRPDAQRRSRGHRRDLGIGPEENPAFGRELGFVPDHADRDAIDVGNVGTAKAKRIEIGRAHV